MNIKKKLYLDGLLGKPILRILLFLNRGPRQERPSEFSCKRITFIKMLGGGSLVALHPALLAIREKHPHAQITLICSHRISNYAEFIGVFDHIRLMDAESSLRSIFRIVRTILHVIFCSEILIDLEAKSNLTTVLTALARSRLKVGLIENSESWKKSFYDQTLTLQERECLPRAYDRLSEIFLATANFAKSRDYLLSRLVIEAPHVPSKETIVIGVGCSDFFPERRMQSKEWALVLLRLFQTLPSRFDLYFLGNQGDRKAAQEIMNQIPEYKNRIYNLCGELSLAESLAYLRRSRLYLGVDSGLMQFAGILGSPKIGFWGPTQPHVQLREHKVGDLHLSKSFSCSPCVQKKISGRLSCRGLKPCMDHGLDAERVVQHLREIGILHAETSTMVEPGDLKFSVPTPI